jgi:murein L,D-transpeptidase YcbB/YkuD
MRPVSGVLKSAVPLTSTLLLVSLLAALPGAPAAADAFETDATDGIGPAPAVAASHPGHDTLLAAFDRYQRIVADGGWAEIPSGPTLVPGEPAAPERLTALADRLAAEDDLEPVGPPEAVYDALLSEAVRRFQERHGLEVDGKVGPSTLAALNVPARERLSQIELNLERWREVPGELPERRIEINLPAYELTTYDAGRLSGAMKIVVGKPSSPTPTFRDRVTHVILRPYWNVPAGITARELVPQARRSPSSLAARGFEVRSGNGWVSPSAVDWSNSSGRGYRIRQRPGSGNSLGLVKFDLKGQSLIYLHDTPEQHAFRRADRALSHGCVRLERPLELAEWLLAGEDGWDSGRIRSAATSGSERWVSLETDVPVYVRYFTAWADDRGQVQFRDDVYSEDPGVLARLEHRKALEAERLAAGQSLPGSDVSPSSERNRKQENVERSGSRTSASSTSGGRLE